MKEEVKQLQELKEKVENTWELLKIDNLKVEQEKLEQKMQSPDFWSDAENAKNVSKRYDGVKQEVEVWEKMKNEINELLEFGNELENSPDEELQEDLKNRTKDLFTKFEKLEFYLLLGEKYDKGNAILTFSAGSGGTEAQDWAEMIRRMVMRFAEDKGWKVEMIDESRGSEAGIKSCMIRIEGRYAYGYLQALSGTHRLVRISPFDAEKMRHTSFASIEIIPEIDEEIDLEIDPKDLRIDTFMSGGKGGQSVNTTYSAVRIVHLPTNITVQCQNERSQLQNKDTAMKVLQSKLQKLKEEELKKEKQELRGEYKSAEWGNQIISYVLHPYKMVKDLRSKYETVDTEKVLNGELIELAEAYLRWKKGEKQNK
ncbi:MAG: peptide chain release factor 2 [Candidatus Magasanikbacteria bacterium]|nr:peptide chain release factor 2 [Candidatus Magasanikbacteria bacterium]